MWKAKDTNGNKEVIFKVKVHIGSNVLLSCFKSNPVHKTSTNKFTSIDAQDRHYFRAGGR